MGKAVKQFGPDLLESENHLEYCKTSYIDAVGETLCNDTVEQAGQHDIGKTLSD